MATPAASPLARYLLAAYVLLIAYASLYPLASWRDQGVGAFAFLIASLPRYTSAFDVFANLAAYFPLGFLVAAIARVRHGATFKIALGTIAGLSMSVAMEALQSFIPSRHPSNLDVATNTAGALLGAIGGAVIAPRLLGPAGIIGLRERWFRAGAAIDFGVVIVALWLVTQLNPEGLLFGAGSLRDVVDAVPSQHHGPIVFVRIEAAVVASQLAAIGLFCGALVATGRPAWLVGAAIVLAALVVRAIAFAVLFTPAQMFAWVTRGALYGLAAGTVVFALACLLPRVARMGLAGLLLMSATALVNIAPANPYMAQTLQVWRQGHFLNFNGLTGFVSSAWPFIALAYLLAFGNRRSAQE